MNKELEICFNILNKIYFENAYSSIELNKICSKNLNFKLITKIVYGVIENDVKINYYLQQFFNKKPKKQLLLILKIAAFIKLNINSIPNFAITNELVNLTKRIGLKPYAGFVNATIKNILKTDFTLPNKTDLILYYSVKYSKPIWFIKLLQKYYKEYFLDYLNCCLETSTHIRVNNLKIETKKFEKLLIENGVEFKRSQLDNAYYVDYEKLNKLENLKGLYAVQGVPSMIVSKNVSGNYVLDSCSAPGGKAIYYASQNSFSHVVACDYLPHRVELINAYAKSQGITNITTKIVDAKKFNPEFYNKFDCVILDVPCSGLGVINKKPDILLNFNENSLKTLPKMQLEMLTNNAKYVKAGGYLIYSTCTINKAENEEVLNNFLETNKNFKAETIETFNVLALGGDYKTFLPNISNTEGFFIGRIKRND